jgi:hypothetical protein
LSLAWKAFWCRRIPAVASMAAAIILSLAFAVVGLTAGLVIVTDAKDEKGNARRIAEQKEKEAREDREAARFNLYVSRMHLVQRDCETNNVGHARELLESCVLENENLPPASGNRR